LPFSLELGDKWEWWVESVKLLGEEIVDSVNYDGCENHSNPEPVYVALPPTLTL